MLKLGDKLTHIESGLEAEYFTAMPTALHGFVHVLKSAEGYIYRLTGDLESEFSRVDETAPLSQTDGSAASNDAALIDALLSRLRQEGVIPPVSTAAPTGVAPVDTAPAPTPAPVTPAAPVAPVTPAPVVPDASAHLDPTATDAASETDTAAPATPAPANSIPL